MKRDWPQEIKSVQLANFRPTASERHALRDVRRVFRGIATRTGMSQEHLNHLRRMCCTVCSIASNLHAYHLRHGPAAKERGVGMKATDRYAIPMCPMHHDDVHRTGSRFEAEWFARFGINAIDLAGALWANRADIAAKFRVLQAHKEDARRQLDRQAAVNALVRHGLTRREAEEQYDTGFRR